MNIIITGGAGFIGSHVVRQALSNGHNVLNIDNLSYAANHTALQEFLGSPHYQFAQIDIRDLSRLRPHFQNFKPNAIMHLAAETHVDRSIDKPQDFIETNVMGTFNLLEASIEYWHSLPHDTARAAFRFHHISTDEVYGTLGRTGRFTESTPYDPHSPYSASKAASDHLVRAWGITYGLPILITNCSNNYGPGQFPEKLIPLMIIKGLTEEALPVYGTGLNIRDWLYVEDHATALHTVLKNGKIGETYNIGENAEHTNLDIVQKICDILDHMAPPKRVKSRRDLITFVPDRPGHDFRYAMDASKIHHDLNWAPTETFESGLRKTIEWYLDHKSWWQDIRSNSYQGNRLGLSVIEENKEGVAS